MEDLLDKLIARLPVLRENGVTHFNVDPTTGAISMILAPKPLELDPDAQGARPAQHDDPDTYSLPPGTPMPRSFRERRASAAPAVK